ncbi:hypothetical protein N7495_001216 [Penicillium taxi]|uniref:uncharacterized protein n=1 Tax=Penicillium taxi TaxID=168475 RepID=UPI00254554DC|nr:uncharacterized protein N7495_001216 [Penicillium taxi]KAJ5908534.1 hypothetical protein N7495_001216 [Penicillium taxi]
MSGYYGSPFGRLERPANLSESGDNPYQLPPPPGSINAQFGSNAFRQQRHQGENPESGRDTQSSQRIELLPSVRSLLTPTGASSSPSYHQPYRTPTPSQDRRENAFSYHQQDPGLPSKISAVVQDRAKPRPESFPQRQTSALPPLSQVTMHSPGDMKHHTPSRSDPAVTFQHDRIPYHGAPFHEKALGEETSSPDTKGTSALPHVIDERFVEGEGVCYVYADGSHVPKSIDGVAVNANWGITKAGKPRKRLAQACLTCREKKIKCQPNLPKCEQCQKSGRECRFESAPRGSRSFQRASHPPIAPTASDASTSIYSIPRVSHSPTSLPGTSGHSPLSEGPIHTPSAEAGLEATPDAERTFKARIYRAPRLSEGTDNIVARTLDHTENRQPEYADILGDIRDTNPHDPLAGSWNIDPYETEPENTLHYVESFFSSVNDGLYYIFPHTRFILWLKSCRTKSAEDKMLIYSMMSLGSIFSDRSDRIVALKQYSRIARFAIQRSQHTVSLQLAQSHLIMSLLYYATGFLVGSWDSIGAAGRAVCGLRYNVESGGVVVDQAQACDYGFHPHALIECRRRTYWVAFILDRVSSFFSASSTFISSEAALIRLPCREDIYEAQQYATAPFFQSVLNQATTSPDEDCSTLSHMAFLIQIMSIWGDVSLHVFRSAHVPSDGYARLAEEFNTTTTHRTEDWKTRIPEHLTFSAINLERAIQTKKSNAFISIHMFYHATLMKLYRHARYSSLRSEVLVQYIHRARFHAVEILRIALAFFQASEIQYSRITAENLTPTTNMLSPFLGYVILSAADLLSAAGMLVELPDCISTIRGALGMVRLLGRHWDSSLVLVNTIQRRLEVMVECLNDRSRIQDKIGFAVDGPSLETKIHEGAPSSHPPSALDEDLFFGSMPREILLRAMNIEGIAVSKNSIAWMRDR